MPKETSTTAHPELADLSASLGFVLNPDHGNPHEDWWDHDNPDGLLARVVAWREGFTVFAFTGWDVAWSARLTSGTPAAVLAAAMAVAAEGTR